VEAGDDGLTSRMSSIVDTSPRAVLTLRDAIGLTVGTIVGVGIFRTPSVVAEHAGSAGVALLAWLAGGLVSLLGALCYAELASAYPNTGGDYHYLTRAFGRRLGFLVYSSLAYTGLGALVGVGVLAAGTLGLALTKGGS